jgi:hypothetical protein
MRLNKNKRPEPESDNYRYWVRIAYKFCDAVCYKEPIPTSGRDRTFWAFSSRRWTRTNYLTCDDVYNPSLFREVTVDEFMMFKARGRVNR